MPHIAILSASIRVGRNSHRVALYFKNYLESGNLATTEILDLMEYKFPLFDERLQFQKDPSTGMVILTVLIILMERIIICEFPIALL